MKFTFTTLDVFTTTRYAGNPLAVVQVPASVKSSISQQQKQAIAKEFNLSEIIFLHLPSPGSPFNEVAIDIFTTFAEIPFAGHPTLGASHFLLNVLGQNTQAIITKAGRIPIVADVETGLVKASIPHDVHIHKVTFPSELNSLRNETVSIVNGMSFIFVELPDLATLAKASRTLAPATYDTSPLDDGWQSGLIGTMYLVSQWVDEAGWHRYRTRMFVDEMEDPGTGSASCALACWLALKKPEDSGVGPFKFAFTQGIEMGRQNDIAVEITRDDSGEGIKEVIMSGAAVKVMEGTLEI